jgi:hypothetical protein
VDGDAGRDHSSRIRWARIGWFEITPYGRFAKARRRPAELTPDLVDTGGTAP